MEDESMSKKSWKNNKYEGLETETFGVKTETVEPPKDEPTVEPEVVEEKEEEAPAEKEVEKSTAKTVKAVVDGDFKNLNVRTTPEIGNNIIAELPKGSKVEIIENFGEWSYIRFKAATGLNGEAYVMTKFLKIKE
jgi:hypothetical protein